MRTFNKLIAGNYVLMYNRKKESVRVSEVKQVIVGPRIRLYLDTGKCYLLMTRENHRSVFESGIIWSDIGAGLMELRKEYDIDISQSVPLETVLIIMKELGKEKEG